MAYTYDPIFAQDPNNPNVVASNASITIYDPADPGKNPITITDPTGSPLPNPITVDARGMGSAFQHATLDRVAWTGGGLTNYFTSYEGMKNEATEARAAAQGAADTATAAAAQVVTNAAVNGSGKLILTKANGATQDAGSVIGPKGDKGDKGNDGSNVLPTDTAIKNAISTPGTETAAALSATIDTQVAAPLAGKASLTPRGMEDLEAERAKRLRAFHRRLAGREGSKCYVWAIGHSFIEGAGVTNSTKRFTAQLHKALNAQFPTTGVTTPGLGYVTWATPAMGNMGDLPITHTDVPKPSTHGIGRHTFELSTAAHKVTLTNSQTNRLFLVITKKPGAGIGYYKVDGGAAVTFDTANATVADGQLVNIVVTSGVHSVEVGWSSGGTVTFNGFMVFNGDASIGTTVVSHGTSSTRTDFWLDAGAQSHWDNIKTFAPSLVVITDMRNDWSGGVPSATVKANLKAIIGKINAQYAATAQPSIVICAEISDALGTAPTEPWANYVAKAKELEGEHGNVLVFDLAPRFGDTVADAGILISDGVHPNDAGVLHWVAAFTRFISPR